MTLPPKRVTVSLIPVLLAIVAVVMLVAGVTPWCLIPALIGAVWAFRDNRRLRKALRD